MHTLVAISSAGIERWVGLIPMLVINILCFLARNRAVGRQRCAIPTKRRRRAIARRTRWSRVVDGAGVVCENGAHAGGRPMWSTQCVQADRLTIYGQMLDTDKRPVDQMTPELYADIVRHKTSHYTFYLPVELALIVVR